MAKFERFLDEYSWLFKSGIVLALIFWATQLYVPMWQGLIKEIQDFKSRDLNVEYQAQQELNLFYENIIKEAKQLGKAYSPKIYFGHLELLERKKHEIKKKYHTENVNANANTIWMLSYENIREGLFSMKEAQDLGAKHGQFMRDGGPKGEEALNEAQKEVKSLGWKGVASKTGQWLLIFYLRSLLLVIAFYFVRMAQRKGILATVLSDKRKFILAIVAWPIMISKYPYNVVREIVVAAELRRFGKLFRRFTGEEKEAVRRIAEQDDYQKIIRSRHEHAFARSFLVALLPALLLYLFVPAIEASTERLKKARGDTAISAEQVLQQESAKSHSTNNQLPHILDCISECSAAILAPKDFVRLELENWLGLNQILPDEIDCIPNVGY